jgi:hypothetical protein
VPVVGPQRSHRDNAVASLADGTQVLVRHVIRSVAVLPIGSAGQRHTATVIPL